MTNLQKQFLGLAVLSGIFSANLALAGLVPCGTTESGRDCTLCDLWRLASNIINFITMKLVIPLAAFLFVVAGVIFLTSGGNEKNTGLAKSILINTVVGLIIIFVSWLFIDTFLKTIAKGEFVGAWNKFPTCQ